MNINPKAKRVLCYGDSNTWGFIPLTGKRYPADIRWTGILQTDLGNSYEIIEEGLNSRTTNLDDPNNTGKNGKIYLYPCLETHSPIDFLVLFLGTNDLKARFSRTSGEIARGIEDLIETIILFATNKKIDKPKIILLSPPLLDDSVKYVREKYAGATLKCKKLPSLYRDIASKYKLDFLNTQEITKPSPKDGCHFEPESHMKLGLAIAQEIKKIDSD